MAAGRISVSVLAGLLMISTPAIADSLPNDNGITSFDPDHFTQYNPISALDMVAQLPGFSIDNGDNVRGFGGAAGNVLINGERPSAKSGLENFLRRIPVDNVARIDLVRGTSAELDMRGQSRVVNVVLREDLTTNQLNYTVSARLHDPDQTSLYANADWSTQFAGGNLTVSLTRHGWAGTNARREFRYTFPDTLFAYRDEVHVTSNRAWTPGFEYSRDFGDSVTFRANGRAWDGSWRLDQTLAEYRPTPDSPLFAEETGRVRDEWVGYDFGGDIDVDITEAISSKIIWYQRRETFNSQSRFEDILAASGFDGAFEADIEDSFGESIIRSQTGWRLNDAHSIEFGGEIAYNFRDADRSYSYFDASGGVPNNIPVTTTKVEEWRGEVFLSDVWVVTDRLTLEPAIVVEYSEIGQTGDAEATRTFTFPKPALAATYTLENDRQWRLSVERLIAQLNFEDFVSNVSAFEDNVRSGNPELEPDQTWRFEVSYEQPIMSTGNLALTARYDAVEDVMGFIPITSSSGAIFDGPGNMGDGTRVRLSAEAAIPTDSAGIQNGRLDIGITYRDSEVEDPVTGETRVFAYEQPLNWNVEFRQDFPEQQWSYGFDYNQGTSNDFYFIDEWGTYERGTGDFDVYVETSRFLGVNLRFGADNIFGPDGRRTRNIYDGPRSNGIQTERYVRNDDNGPVYYIQLKGTV